MRGALRANGWLLFAARRFLSKSLDPRSRDSRNATAPPDEDFVSGLPMLLEGARYAFLNTLINPIEQVFR